MSFGLRSLPALFRHRRRTSDIATFIGGVHDVIAVRTLRGMTGRLSASEARLMVAEKQLAAVRAQFAYMDAVCKGDPASALGAYFGVYQRAVQGNRKRLGQRRRWQWFTRWFSQPSARGGRRRLAGLFAAALVLPAALSVLPPRAHAQEIDFGRIDKFESLGRGTLHVGDRPKVIVDDGEQHTVVLTIWDADAKTKVYWTSPDDNTPRTTIVPGEGVQTFQTAGDFRLEAVGEPYHEVQYGYVLLHLNKHRAGS